MFVLTYEMWDQRSGSGVKSPGGFSTATVSSDSSEMQVSASFSFFADFFLQQVMLHFSNVECRSALYTHETMEVQFYVHAEIIE